MNSIIKKSVAVIAVMALGGTLYNARQIAKPFKDTDRRIQFVLDNIQSTMTHRQDNYEILNNYVTKNSTSPHKDTIVKQLTNLHNKIAIYQNQYDTSPTTKHKQKIIQLEQEYQKKYLNKVYKLAKYSKVNNSITQTIKDIQVDNQDLQTQRELYNKYANDMNKLLQENKHKTLVKYSDYQTLNDLTK